MQAEDLHFLRGLDAGAGLAHVVELAPLRRPRVVERVALRVEVRLAEEGRHQRDREQQRSATARRRSRPAAKLTIVTTSCAWPNSWLIRRHAAHGLPARALEPVLQLAVLEVLEVERRGVLHQPHAGRVGEALRQQRVEQRDDAAEHVGQHRQRRTRARAATSQWSSSAAAPPAPQRRPAPPARCASAHHLVDDQLADVQRRHRQQRAQEPRGEIWATVRPGLVSRSA